MELLLGSSDNHDSPVKTTQDLLDVLYKSFFAEVDPDVVNKEIINETLLIAKVDTLEQELTKL